MLFVSLFLFAGDALVVHDMGMLNFSPSPAFPTVASPARGSQYTAYLQKKPPALSLVPKRADSEAQAKKLLEQVGEADNFKELTTYNSANSKIDTDEHGQFTIIDRNVTKGEFDGFYRVQAAEGEKKMYKLVVQNVRSLDILKSFMAELLKAYIGKEKLFKEVTTESSTVSAAAAVVAAGQERLRQSPKPPSQTGLSKTGTSGNGGTGDDAAARGKVEQESTSNQLRGGEEEQDVWLQPWQIVKYGVPIFITTVGVCWFFFTQNLGVNNTSPEPGTCAWDTNVLEAVKQVWEVCYANASSTNAVETCPARILHQEQESSGVPLFQAQSTAISSPVEVIRNATLMYFAFCWANSTMLDPVTTFLGTCSISKDQGALVGQGPDPEVKSVARLAQYNSGQVPPKLSFTETCQAYLYAWLCWFRSLVG